MSFLHLAELCGQEIANQTYGVVLHKHSTLFMYIFLIFSRVDRTPWGQTQFDGLMLSVAALPTSQLKLNI